MISELCELLNYQTEETWNSEKSLEDFLRERETSLKKLIKYVILLESIKLLLQMILICKVFQTLIDNLHNKYVHVTIMI